MIRINQLKLNPNHRESDLDNAIRKTLKLSEKAPMEYTIVKRSIDARKKPDIKYTYSVDVSTDCEERILKHNKNKDIMKAPQVSYTFPASGQKHLKHPPVIAGAGPAGLFCGLFLARAGYRPIVIERGEDVDSRKRTVNHFWETQELNTESNVSFGEGGAGTFSDGKLNTMVKDTSGRIKCVLETFVQYGAPYEITYVNKPHIGTDVLCDIVKNIRNEIIRLGGEVRFQTKLTGLHSSGEQIESIEVNNGEIIPCEVLVLAIGHSARDTFYLLDDHKIIMSPKAFAVGVRVEHPQDMMNYNAYGDTVYDNLPTADYKVTHQCENKRGVYSFCMCPGGYVVNASSENEKLAINGMSYSKRDSKNANSAIIVTVTPEDFKSSSPLAGIEFQRELEEKAYREGGGSIPVQLYGDFVENRPSTQFGEVTPCMKGHYKFGNIQNIFPKYISDTIIEGMEGFTKQIAGFNRGDALISAVESRTSSPVRIVRDENFESNIAGIYPCGEGAGYAGGITSAAVDGIKIAEQIAIKYKTIGEEQK